MERPIHGLDRSGPTLRGDDPGVRFGSVVEEVLRRGIPYVEEDEEGHKGGPTGYLAWKMMVSKQFDV